MTRPVKPRPKARQSRSAEASTATASASPLPLLRTSERRSFKRCPQQWQWGWRDGLTPYGPPALALWFGTGWHEVMAHRYGKAGKARGATPLKVWRDWVGDEMRVIRVNLTGRDDYKEEVYLDAAKLGEEMIGNYLDEYGKDERWNMIQVEKSFEVVIADSSGRQRVLFCGTYDGVFQDLRDGTYWLLEHKTAKSIVTSHLTLDDQAGGYLMVAARELAHAGLIPKGKQIKGIMYNFARKSIKDTRPVDSDGLYHNKPTKADYLAQLNSGAVATLGKAPTLVQLEQLAADTNRIVLGEVSKSQPAKLFLREPIIRTVRERNAQVGHIQAEVEHMEMMRTGQLPIYKTPGRDCKGGCTFYDMCVLHEGGGPDWEEYRDSVFTKRDPYADHRKSAAGDEQ